MSASNKKVQSSDIKFDWHFEGIILAIKYYDAFFEVYFYSNNISCLELPSLCKTKITSLGFELKFGSWWLQQKADWECAPTWSMAHVPLPMP